MEVRLIQTITDAEKEATEQKAQAAAKAELLAVQAEEKARTTRAASAEVCKAYTDTQLRLAVSRGEKFYADEIAKAHEDAARTVDKAKANEEIPVSGIVSRIVSGKEERA